MGPGKAELVARIADTGSISAAARAIRMSYRRAWQLVEALNHDFREPVVTTAIGGDPRAGGPAKPIGDELVCHRRARVPQIPAPRVTGPRGLATGARRRPARY